MTEDEETTERIIELLSTMTDEARVQAIAEVCLTYATGMQWTNILDARSVEAQKAHWRERGVGVKVEKA